MILELQNIWRIIDGYEKKKSPEHTTFWYTNWP